MREEELQQLPAPVQHFVQYFENLEEADYALLPKIYHENVVFTDPLHSVEGLSKLANYFATLNRNLRMGRFYFVEVDTIQDKTYLRWIFDAKLKRPKSRVRVEGVSLLYHDDKVRQQKDYYDLGALAYEHVPVLGRLIKKMKKSMALNAIKP